MWPWGHLAVGYLVYAAIVWYRQRRAPADLPVLALALGTQAPDLVDKPLGWYLGVLPGGRALAHSVFAMGVVVGVAAAARRREGATTWTAFAVGYLSHPVADTIGPLVGGEYGDLAFLLWPLVRLPENGEVNGLVSLIQESSLSLYLVLQVVITAVAILIWIRQGQPGVTPIFNWLYRRLPALPA